MAKGGARARSGPAPDADALRRERDEGDWTVLPSAGREGDPPAWPLADPTDRERSLWAQEWKRPQAIMWERNGQELEVALYVRAVIAAEQHGAATNTRTLVKQLMEALGVSVPGMLRNRWRIERDGDEAPTVATNGATKDASGSARKRFTVVDGTGS